MMFSVRSVALSLLSLTPLLSSAAPVAEGPGVSRAVQAQTFNHVTIFDPPTSYTIPRTLYARSITVGNAILATWENYGPEKPYFPIYQSNDGGLTWFSISKIVDTQNNWGMRYQPFLYVLPQAIGNFPKGTILCAGSSIPEDLSITQIELYASRDNGYTWSFVSHIARGGKGLPENGLTPVWEPFLLAHNNQLIVYYSDQRDPKYGQKIVHQVSTDAYNWGPVVNDVAYAPYSSRPGMPVIAQLKNGAFMMTYEYGGAPEGNFAVYYRISGDPLAFASRPHHVLKSSDGTIPTGSPYVIWTPAGASAGTIIVSSGGRGELYINRHGGDYKYWTTVKTPETTSYTRSLLRTQDDNVLIVGGGVILGKANKVTCSRMDVLQFPISG